MEDGVPYRKYRYGVSARARVDFALVGVESSQGERAESVERAARVWSGQLVDLSARNNLLFFKDLKVGTLDLGTAPAALLFDVLAGKSVSVKRLFPDDEARANAVKRARAVRNRSQEHFEERGLETLFLACGMATWTNLRGTATPAAPVLLVPARLAPRGAAQEEFEVAVTGELEVNPTLLQVLQTEFDVTCDPEELLAQAGIEGAIDTQEELDVTFGWLTERCQNVAGFSVAPRFVLGTFSYAKLPMVKDLEGSLEAMMQHELIAALAGDDAARGNIRERRPQVDPSQPDHTPAEDEFLVLDADASQNYAINAVLGGQDLVIKGPPGTGKSQTIANLVSTLVARGKRVLFVAEKRAAIDAVLRRLDEVGLGDLVLDLHGGAGSRRVVAQALASALTTNASIPRVNLEPQHRLVETRRAELNTRTEALHCERAPWGLSFFDAQARLLALDPTARTEVRFRAPALTSLGKPVYDQARDDLRAYAGLGGFAVVTSGSPWAHANVTSAEQAQSVQALLDRLQNHTIPTTSRQLEQAARASGLEAPHTIGGWRERLALWHGVQATLATFEPGIFSEPLGELVETLAPLGAGAGARASATLTSGEYRAARKRLRLHLREGSKPKPAARLECLQSAAGQQAEWRRTATNGAVPSPPENLAELAAGFEQLQAELEALGQFLNRDGLDGTADELLALTGQLLSDVATLAKLPELHRLRSGLERLGLGELLADLGARNLPPEVALTAFEHGWLSSIIDHLHLTDMRIAGFDGEQHTRTVSEFQEADRAHIQTTAQRVRRLCAEQATTIEDEYADQGALIRDQAARKRKHLSVRQLFSAAPETMLGLKPCWAMSPLVVSQLLPGDRQYFDVVVFDEASQVRPADAIPAILRGKRLVVAGDERQLPPTDFFTGSNPDVDAPELEGRIVLDSGFESILEAMLPFIDFRMLRWHYRSRDERLIAFSNAHLYDRQMTTFPGVAGPEAVCHVLVPHRTEVGSEVSSSAEVKRVVELIIEHAETRSDESLGVIAMGIKHADRIDEALRQELHDRPDLEEFFSEARQERFFVKNLERVQGDERDAIILSVGYGKTPEGRLLYRFGPLNQEGGERRLNVAVTRAKNRMTLVSAFTHLDMDPNRSAARGVELLRLYLQYAASGGDTLGEAAHGIPELNPFEVDVRDTLTRAGIPLCAQYGASGFRIDYAAQHPTNPGRMVLAIECDGASYHSSETARDRDRLRQEHLERLGWRFHRIWSQDWFNDKEKETQKALAAYETAVTLADASGEDGSGRGPLRAPAAEAQPPETQSTVPDRGPRPYLFYDSIADIGRAELCTFVRWVEADTLLRTNEQLLDEVIRELGFARRGRRIVAAVEAAIAEVRRQLRPPPPPPRPHVGSVRTRRGRKTRR